MGKILGSLTDDKGLFQGGEEGRFLGRTRDRLEGQATSYDPSMAEDQDLWQHARGFAENIDTGSSDDVGELQRMLNQLGITDEEGASFKEDSILGAKTMQGLRQLQGKEDYPYREGPYAPEEWDTGEGSSPKSWMQKLFSPSEWGGASGKSQRARNKLFKPKTSAEYPGMKYKRR